MATRAPLGVLLVVILVMSGRNGPSRQEETKRVLMMMGLQYHKCCDELGQPPIGISFLGMGIRVVLCFVLAMESWACLIGLRLCLSTELK